LGRGSFNRDLTLWIASLVVSLFLHRLSKPRLSFQVGGPEQFERSEWPNFGLGHFIAPLSLRNLLLGNACLLAEQAKPVVATQLPYRGHISLRCKFSPMRNSLLRDLVRDQSCLWRDRDELHIVDGVFREGESSNVLEDFRFSRRTVCIDQHCLIRRETSKEVQIACL
jgi:hypothetical protein